MIIKKIIDNSNDHNTFFSDKEKLIQFKLYVIVNTVIVNFLL